MIKKIEVLVVIVILSLFSFFIGVKYSDKIKGHASWLFESHEDEVELPDLSNENNAEVGAVVSEGSEVPNSETEQDVSGANDGAGINAAPAEQEPAAVAQPTVAKKK
jgi:hypothetical protein